MTSEPTAVEPAIAGVLSGVSVSHDRATLETIEATAPEDPAEAMGALSRREEVLEALVLSTCNRVEWYVVTEPSVTVGSIVGELIPPDAAPAARWLGHDTAIEHLMRVSAGLESMVIGEDEILGQLRRACRAAEEAGALGPLLEETTWKAIHLGERVRTETGINEGVTSLGRAAVQRAAEEAPVNGSHAVVVGAGDMGSVAAHALADAGVDRLTVLNRTPANVEPLAADVPIPVEIADLTVLEEAIAAADVTVTATGSSTPLIDRPAVDGTAPGVIVDLGQPRDVAPPARDLPGITYLDLDDVEAITREANEERQAAAAVAADMVDDAVDELQITLKRRQADDVIAAMYASAERIKHRELSEAVRRVAAGEDPVEDVLDDFADALVGHLLAAPTTSLRDAAEADDWETIQTALRLFDPEFADGSVEPSEGEVSAEDAVDFSSAQR